MVTVSQDEICAAVRDCFEDTRAMLEPAGAIAVAGLKKYVDKVPVREDGTRGNYVVISSDASNIEFDILRFIAERAHIGEQKEKVERPPHPHGSAPPFTTQHPTSTAWPHHSLPSTPPAQRGPTIHCPAPHQHSVDRKSTRLR